MMVFGLLALMATILTVFLPETKDREIPDNMNDVEELRDLGRRHSDGYKHTTSELQTREKQTNQL